MLPTSPSLWPVLVAPTSLPEPPPHRIRKEPKAFRALAMGLRAQFSDDLTDWEKDFLEAIAGRDGKKEFTTRQSEKLLQIRDDYTSVSQLPGGFSVRIVLEECKEAR